MCGRRRVRRVSSGEPGAPCMPPDLTRPRARAERHRRGYRLARAARVTAPGEVVWSRQRRRRAAEQAEGLAVALRPRRPPAVVRRSALPTVALTDPAGRRRCAPLRPRSTAPWACCAGGQVARRAVGRPSSSGTPRCTTCSSVARGPTRLGANVPAERERTVPADVGLRLARGATVTSLPVVVGFVGADHVAMLLAAGARRTPADRLVAFCDVGTNTEISSSGAGATACSAASGPCVSRAHVEAGMRAAPGDRRGDLATPAGRAHRRRRARRRDLRLRPARRRRGAPRTGSSPRSARSGGPPARHARRRPTPPRTGRWPVRPTPRRRAGPSATAIRPGCGCSRRRPASARTRSTDRPRGARSARTSTRSAPGRRARAPRPDVRQVGNAAGAARASCWRPRRRAAAARLAGSGTSVHRHPEFADRFTQALRLARPRLRSHGGSRGPPPTTDRRVRAAYAIHRAGAGRSRTASDQCDHCPVGACPTGRGRAIRADRPSGAHPAASSAEDPVYADDLFLRSTSSSSAVRQRLRRRLAAQGRRTLTAPSHHHLRLPSDHRPPATPALTRPPRAGRPTRAPPDDAGAARDAVGEDRPMDTRSQPPTRTADRVPARRAGRLRRAERARARFRVGGDDAFSPGAAPPRSRRARAPTSTPSPPRAAGTVPPAWTPARCATRRATSRDIDQTFWVCFPVHPDGDAAREVSSPGPQASHDRRCTVSHRGVRRAGACSWTDCTQSHRGPVLPARVAG